MADQTVNVVLKTVADISDVKTNIDALQKQFSKLRLPDKLGDNLNKKIGEFNKEWEKYQKKVSEGIKTQGDANAVDKMLSRMAILYKEIGQEASKIKGVDIKDLINFDDQVFVKLRNQIKETVDQISNIKIDKTGFTKAIQDITSITKSKKIVGADGLLNQIIGHFDAGEIDLAEKKLQELRKYQEKVRPRTKIKEDGTEVRVTGTMSEKKYELLSKAIDVFDTSLNKAKTDAAPFITTLNDLQKELQETETAAGQDVLGNLDKFQGATSSVDSVTDSLKRMHAEEFSFNNQVQQIDRQVQSYFGLSQIIRKVGNIARQAFQTVKDLDAAMVETAVVTNFDVGDMWEMLPTYTKNANELGSTIKDVYEASTLYYQQGLNTAQAMGLANETLKMARIGGLEAKEATDMMTAALRGFNMQINELSAKRINDVYSELAAITASDTRELGSAMERTASIANSAGMQFETTSAFLAQMIEVTREAPENLGTAMKTIVARFQEMKEDPTKLVDSEGVMMDANRVDKALKTIGINLMDTNGQFRNLDEVFLEISSRWDGLTQAQQRYIATIAAGSRQQSRFIAMMQNHERVTELVEAANNSAGASQRQFNKTLEGMSAKLNRLQNAWNQFSMGLANNQIIKFGVDTLTEALTVINKIIDVLSGAIPDPFGGIVKSVLTLSATLGGLNLGRILTKGLITGGVSWWEGTGFTQAFSKELFGEESLKKAFVSKGKKFTNPLSKVLKKTTVPVPISFNDFFKVDSKTFTKDVEDDLTRGLRGISQKVASNQWSVDKGNQALQSLAKNYGAEAQTLKTAKAFEELNKRSFSASKGLKSVGQSFKALGQAIIKSPIFWVGAAIAAIGVTVWAFNRQLKADEIQLERVAAAAGAASDAYSSASQATSELRDNIEKIKEAEAAFDGLVVGTVEFNEQLVKSNELILNLLKKYPLLNDYLTIDSNGRMEISTEGYEEVLKYQREIQSRAAAINVWANAAYDAKKYRNELKNTYGIGERTALENRPVATRGGLYMVPPTSDTTRDLTKEEQREVDLLNQKIKASEDTGRYQAALTVLSGQELKNQEAIARLYTDQYDTLEDSVKLRSKAENYQEYADFYGYTYEGGKLKDIDGNVLDIEYDEILKTLPEIQILTNIDVNGESVDKAISELNSAFRDNLDIELEGEDSNVSSFISDILAKNIDANEELIDKLLEDNTDLVETIHGMSKEEVALILGKSADDLTEPLDTYYDEVETRLNENMEAIKKSQTERSADLAAMIGETTFGPKVTDNKRELAWQKRQIEFQMKSLTASQRKTLQATGAALRDAAGRNSMTIMVRGMQQMYNNVNSGVSGARSSIRELQSIIDGVNWDSPTQRLITYNEMINSSKESVRELGEELMNSEDSTNLITEAFGEMYTSQPFQDAMEDASEFMDATGRYTATGVLEMSKSVGTMKELIDSGIISAGGMAAALNAISGEGDLTYLDLNDNILKLISSFNQLDTVVANAHQTIANFDAGVDTGESEDFIKEQVENFKALYENGEWGNPQMEAYAKLIVGQEKWDEAVKKSLGNTKKLYQDLYDDINLFSDGFYDAWASMADVGGKNTVDPNNLVTWQDGHIELNIDGDINTTEEVLDYLQQSLGITKEAAEMMLTDFKNYSWDLTQDLAKNDFEAGLENTDYFRDKTVNGQVHITESDIKLLAQSMNMTEDEVTDRIEEAVTKQGLTLDVLNNINDKTGELRDDYAKLNKEGGFTTDYLQQNYESEDSRFQGAIDASKVLGGLKNMGYGDTQTYGMLYEQLQEANENGIDFVYEGEILDPDDFSSLEDFIEKLTKIDETIDWVEIGESIAEGMDRHEQEQARRKQEEKEREKEEREKRNKETREKHQKSISPSNAYTDANTGNPNAPVPISKDMPTGRQIIQTEINTRYGSGTNFSIEEFSKWLKEEKNINIDTKGIGDTKELISYFDEWLIKTDHKVIIDADTTDAYEKIEEVENEKPTVSTTLSPVDNVSPTITNIVNGQYIATLTLDGDATEKFKKWWNRFGQLRDKGLAARGTVTTRDGKIYPIQAGTEAAGNARTPLSSLPSFGSAANGTKGKLGPKNQGGLTLTGELGYEIAWLPSEGRSVVLGTNGPQMVNLPKDAVVYNHEQSKKILKGNKSIQAGSLSGGYDNRDNSGSIRNGSTTSKSTNKKDNKEETKITINNWSIEEVIRFNIEKKIDKYQQIIDKYANNFNDLLERIGASSKTINQNYKKQQDSLKAIINLNNDEADSYRRQLKQLNKSQRTSISWSSKSGDSKNDVVDIGDYIYKKNGIYQINKKKIQTDFKTKAKQEAVYNAAQSALDPLVSGLANAEKGAADAKKELQELDKQVYDAFYGWENELTKIYNLTQKIEIDSSMIDRFNSQVSLELARLGAGFGSVNTAVTNMTKVLGRSNIALKDQVKRQQDLITARRQEIKTNTSLSDELELRNTMRKRYGKKSGEYKEANEEVQAQRLTNKYMKVSYNRDGSASVNVNWKSLEKARLKGNITKTEYDAIKERIDETTKAITDYNSSIQDQTELLANLYDQLAEYQKTIADFEDTLLKQLEDDLKKQVDNAKTLNQSLTAALKDILDTVKKRLQERRQAEDNAKTERDISQKQQRLNLLRANTAGGNQVEIAQLEKEIADAQQSYRRTLEDQLLQKLQDQGDEAAKQREQQIKLAEQQLDTQKIQLKERVARWMQHPKTYEKVMKDAWLKANDYDDKGLYGQQLLLQEWDKTFAEYREAAIQTDYVKSGGKTLLDVITEVGSVRTAITNLNLKTGRSAQYYKDAGKTVAEAKKANKDFTVKELKQGGYSYSEIRKGGYKLQDFIDSGVTDAKTLRAAGFGKYALYNKGYTTTALKAAGYKTSDMVTNTIMRGVAATIRKTGGGWLPENSNRLEQVFGENSAKKIRAYVNNKNFDPEKYYKKGVYTYAAQKKKKYAKYQTGGLADYTGPAWLDGTPSKPELVLNATDTQNFIQLKDILSSALRSGALETSAVTVGDTNFEVNINVDHIASDYDVDRVAERVKKKIVESSSYRNVTSVRKFR